MDSTSPAILTALDYHPTGTENRATCPEWGWLSPTQLSPFPDVSFPPTSPSNLSSRPPFTVAVQSTMFEGGAYAVHVFIPSKAEYHACTLGTSAVLFICCSITRLFLMVPMLCKGLHGQPARTDFPDLLGSVQFQIFGSVCHINTLCSADIVTYFRLRKQGTLAYSLVYLMVANSPGYIGVLSEQSTDYEHRGRPYTSS